MIPSLAASVSSAAISKALEARAMIEKIEREKPVFASISENNGNIIYHFTVTTTPPPRAAFSCAKGR